MNTGAWAKREASLLASASPPRAWRSAGLEASFGSRAAPLDLVSSPHDWAELRTATPAKAANRSANRRTLVIVQTPILMKTE